MNILYFESLKLVMEEEVDAIEPWNLDDMSSEGISPSPQTSSWVSLL
jgi:hypothetical protein